MRLFIFILLGAQVDFGLMGQYLAGGIAVVAVLMLVARPVTVFLCALPDRRARWSLNEMLFMCWTRETGVIPAALAGLLLGMKAPGAQVIASVTFIAILMTILIQAPTTRWLATPAGPAGASQGVSARRPIAAPFQARRLSGGLRQKSAQPAHLAFTPAHMVNVRFHPAPPAGRPCNRFCGAALIGAPQDCRSGRRETTLAIAARSPIRRAGGVLLAALTLGFAGFAQPAAAQGLFQALFGGFRRRAPEPLPAEQLVRRSVGMFGDEQPAGEASGFGHGIVYCVRTCDGRYFPLQRHAGASPAELCKSFCPAAKTMVFSGSKIDTAVAPERHALCRPRQCLRLSRQGEPTTAPATARTGSASPASTPSSDPTLRPGDIVATDGGLADLHRQAARPRNSRRSTRRRANGRGGCPR